MRRRTDANMIKQMNEAYVAHELMHGSMRRRRSDGSDEAAAFDDAASGASGASVPVVCCFRRFLYMLRLAMVL